MLRVVGHFVTEQAPGLSGLACLVCLVAAATAMRLLAARPAGAPWQGLVHLAGAVTAFSAGAWATHFIGLLAFRPHVPFGFDLLLCALSLALVGGVTTIAFAIRPGRRRMLGLLQGLLLATGLAAMHVVGTRAMLLPGKLYYPAGALLLSMGLGFALTMAAMWLLHRGLTAFAAVLLALGALSIDLLGMASVRLELTPGLPIPPDVIPHPLLVATTTGACLVILMLAVGASLLDQRQARRLAAEASRFRALADATFEGLILVRHGTVVDANLAMGELTGRPPEELVGQTLGELLPGLSLNVADGQRTAETALPCADGQARPVEVLWRDDPDRTGHVVAVRDLSREKAAESLIERLSRLDPLTGLLNRDAFEHQVERAVLQPHRRLTGLAVLHIGLDRFDLVGEQIGLAATEPLLVQLAQRLIGIVRRTDAVGRLERDEFAILQVMPGGEVDPAALAERILEEIGTRFTVNDQSVRLTLNIGVAIHPTDGSTARELMRNAALASAQARRDGRNGWRSFESGMEQRLRERQILRQALRVALTKNQFTLNYQPIVDAMTFEIAGYEALLRWDHPERGRIPPADFIPVAEESGLIVAIGTWVLATACAEAVSWERPATIAVNLSPVQFNDPGLVATVAEVLHRTGLPAARLELEITETILIDDKRRALEVLTELKRLGVRLAMDDFGTGYSSLSYLRSFPFDKIKIDRSFIRDVENDAEAESIVQAIIAMGLSLHLKITAEGVETKQQLAMLRAYGCSYLQGFLLGKPASASEIEGRGSAVPMAAGLPAGPIADALGMLAASARPD